MIYPSALLRLIVPVVILGCALLARQYIDGLADESRAFLAGLPYLLAAGNLLAGYMFRRLRLVLAAAALAGLYWLIASALQVSLEQPEAASLYLGASTATPLLALLLFSAPERGVFNRWGLLLTLLSVGAIACSFLLMPAWVDAGGKLAGYFSGRFRDGYLLSPGASGMMALAATAGLVRLVFSDGDLDAALQGALGAAFVALGWLYLDHVSLTTAIAGQCCLTWGVVRRSYAMAYRDELTGLLSRRALNERLKTLGRRYTIAMLDVDRFKRFNDTHGHEVGDDVLRLVASRLRRVGAGGTAYRYGGEEFCVVFPRRALEDSAAVMDQVREQIGEYRLSIRDRSRRPKKQSQGSRRRGATRLRADEVSVTVSAGLAERSEDRPEPEAVISAADAALYRAKQKGRNRVVY